MKSAVFFIGCWIFMSNCVAALPGETTSEQAYGAVFGTGLTKKLCTLDLITRSAGVGCAAALTVDIVVGGRQLLYWLGKGAYNAGKDGGAFKAFKKGLNSDPPEAKCNSQRFG